MPGRAPVKRRRRDYAAEYRRRQERARARGFDSYYQERIRGGAEARPDTSPPPDPDLRRRRAGHAGRSAFLAYIRPGDIVMLADHISHIERGQTGRFVSVEMLVVPEDPRRPTRRFVVHGLTKAGLARMVEAEIEAGAVLTPVPSLDQRRLY